MSDRSLTAEVRTETKKGAARRMRRQGRIPAVMYGHREPLLLSIEAREFATKFPQISESTIIHLTAGGAGYDVLVKDFQVDNIIERLEHIDFFEIERGKLLRTRVLLHFVGTPIGVREGGLQEMLVHEVEVESVPHDLPERIDVNIEQLGVGQSLHVSDLVVPDGVRVLNSPDQVLVLIAHKIDDTADPPTTKSAMMNRWTTTRRRTKSKAVRLIVATGGVVHGIGAGGPGKSWPPLRAEPSQRRLPGGRLSRARLGGHLKRRRRNYGIGHVQVVGSRLTLVRPLTYMNGSGEIIKPVLAECDSGPEDLIVVCDTMDLPPGASRLRLHGSSAGNRGLHRCCAYCVPSTSSGSISGSGARTRVRR